MWKCNNKSGKLFTGWHKIADIQTSLSEMLHSLQSRNIGNIYLQWINFTILSREKQPLGDLIFIKYVSSFWELVVETICLIPLFPLCNNIVVLRGDKEKEFHLLGLEF